MIGAAAALLTHFLWVFTEPLWQQPTAGLAQLQWVVKFHFYIPVPYYLPCTKFVSLFLGVHVLLPLRIIQDGLCR